MSTQLAVDHVEFFVTDLDASLVELVDGYGFEVLAAVNSKAWGGYRSVALGQGSSVVVVTEAASDLHPAGQYVARHGDGVGVIALRTDDAAEAFAVAVANGAAPVSPPADRDGCVTATIEAFGDVLHTFVQQPAHGRCLPGFGAISTAAAIGAGLLEMDHFAVCLEAGALAGAVKFYREVLGFAEIFEEKIEVGAQAMNSVAVQSLSGKVTLTLIEPDTSAEPGQIDDFIGNHGGAGVQHIAFTCEDIVTSVADITARGVRFLDPPQTYYSLLESRLEPVGHTVDELRGLGILVDEDHDGQLYQIFTRTTHPRRTFFFEVIERLKAKTFGSGNIKALYEAVELERTTARESR
jgi:4-hydroxymandelate synthase